MTATSTPVDNGVNVEALLSAREALTATPEAATFHWRATCDWLNGTHSNSVVEGFFGLGEEQRHRTKYTFDVDHPEIFASEDNGATPVEYVLVGLAGCLTAGIAAVAQNREIQLKRVIATVEGDMDVQGILGIDSDVRNGFSDIKVTYNIEADATPDEIRAIVEQSQKRSAVYDIVTNPTNVSVEVVRRAAPREHGGVVRKTDAVVLGAGHCGLAMSRCLEQRSIDHVVLERGEVANSWRTERWDALRLLTPNWQCRLPRYSYEGDDPDGFMTMPQVVEFITRYAQEISAPVQTGSRVVSVRAAGGGYRVVTDQGEWQCPTVVIATGAFNVPHVPDYAEAVPSTVATLTPMQYRNPGQLAEGGVLVVGASATGVQIAQEIRGSGRAVTLAVGEHVRGPRMYRDRDIHWWMEACGVLDERYNEVDDIVRARRVPSMQLGGSPERSTFDLNALTRSGVTLVGRLAAIRDGRPLFSGSLRNKCALADLKLGRLLDTIDEWATDNGLDDDVPPPHRFAPTVVPESPRLELDLTSGEIQTIIWATGFRPDYSWLEVPVLDRKGLIRHDGGVVASPGMYLIGTPFLRRRKSSFIDGGRADAEDLILELSAHLDRQASPAKS